ncbi:MAG: hypothetical protein ACRCTX_07490, partial [Afipia sp.]
IFAIVFRSVWITILVCPIIRTATLASTERCFGDHSCVYGHACCGSLCRFSLVGERVAALEGEYVATRKIGL